MEKRELIALLNLSSWCLMMVERLFLAVPRGCLRFVIVVFPDHTHLIFFISKPVKKKATIRNRNNQIPQLTHDTIWERDKNTSKHHIKESQDVSPFQAGDHKAERNSQDSMTDIQKTQTTKMIHKRRTNMERSVRKLVEGLFDGTSLSLISDVDPDTLFIIICLFC